MQVKSLGNVGERSELMQKAWRRKIRFYVWEFAYGGSCGNCSTNTEFRAGR